MRVPSAVLFTIGLVSYPSEVSAAWGFSSGSDPGKVLLRDVQVISKTVCANFIKFVV